MTFARSNQLRLRMRALVPGGSHTYAKGDDQYPELSPGFVARGLGCHVWDVDGNEFVEYGMGLRSVTLGHAHALVLDAVRAALELGTNFGRPAPVELEAAEAVLGMVRGADMVKFTKDGSTANTAAVKIARAATGRDLVAMCADHPFFSYDDWFIATTTMDGGIPKTARDETLRFRYNDLAGLATLFDRHPRRIAAIILEPERTVPPASGFLEGIQALCRRHGAVLIFDEMITGFRWSNGGAQEVYGVVPDLSTFGKAMANGFSVSALCGARDLMRLGSRERQQDDVFLLSTTHGAETHALAAAIATMKVYRAEPVVAHLHRQGDRLATGLRELAGRHGLADHVFPVGRACNLLFATLDRDRTPSQVFRTLFLQELIRRGVLGPSLVVSYAHADPDIDRTLEALDGALAVYARALHDGPEAYLVGPPSRLVFDRHA
jgi:glutamate-1-semialdehyde 2,1-aminomutase